MKDFLKKYTKTIVCIAVFALMILGSILYLNKAVYGSAITHIPVSTTIKRLFYMVSKVRNKWRIVKILSIFFTPYVIMIIAIFGTLANKLMELPTFEKRETRKKRENIKGSAKWGTLKELKRRGYLYTRNNLPGVIFGQSEDAVVYAPNTFTIQTKKKGKYIIGCDVSKKLGKTPTVNHTLILGATRSGKGISTIIPTLLSYDGSVIVYDPACENYTLTGEYRKKFGKVLYFHPQDQNSTLRFNPLDWINRDKFQVLMAINSICQLLVVNTDPKAKFFDDSARDFVKLFIEYVLLFFPKERQNLYEVASLSKVLKEDDMFSAEKLESRVLLLKERLNNETDNTQKEIVKKGIEKVEQALETRRKEDKEREALIKEKEEENTIMGITSSREEIIKELKKDRPELFRAVAGEGLQAFVDKLYYDIETEKSLLVKEDEKNGSRLILLENAISTLSNLKTFGAMKSEQTMGSIMQTVNASLLFYVDENLKELMSTSSFTKEDLTMKDQSLSLYLNIPNDLTEHFKTYVKLFVSMITSSMTNGSDLGNGEYDMSQEYKKNGKHTVLFILDEFPQLGRMESVENMIPFIGKFGACFMLIAQSLPQLERVYKKEGALGMIDNMQLVNIKKVGLNMETKEWVSKNLGQETISFKSSSSSSNNDGKSGSVSTSIRDEGRNLLTASEVGTLGDDEQLLFIPGANPIRFKKIQWYTEEIFKNRVNTKTKDKKSSSSGGMGHTIQNLLGGEEREENAIKNDINEKDQKDKNIKEAEEEKDTIIENADVEETLNIKDDITMDESDYIIHDEKRASLNDDVELNNLIEKLKREAKMQNENMNFKDEELKTLSVDNMLSLPYSEYFDDDFAHNETGNTDSDNNIWSEVEL